MINKSKNYCYLDANFLISFFLPNHKWHNRSKKVMYNLCAKNTNLLISCLALDETFYLICEISNKQSRRDKIKRPKDFYSNYEAMLHIILKNPLMRVIQFEKNLIKGLKNTLENIRNYDLDPRDAFHYAMMQDLKVNCIVTNNKKDFGMIPGLNIITF